MLGELVPEVLFGCYWCCFYVFAVSVDYVSSFCESYCVGSVAMVMVTSTNHCAIILLNHYLLKKKHNFWQYHISCFIIFIIIVQIIWQPISYWHDASYCTVKQYCSRAQQSWL